MSNVIRLLETMGRRVMTPAEFDESVRRLEGDDSIKQALFRRDEAALGQLLGARPVLCCMILADERPMHRSA
jgi:hypothetical protein